MAGRHLYVFQAAVTGAVKVGRSDNPERRLNDLQVGCPYRLKIILVAPSQGHSERRVHEAMKHTRTRFINGEWFHEIGIGSIPDDIWEHTIPWYREDPDWWKRN